MKRRNMDIIGIPAENWVVAILILAGAWLLYKLVR